MSLVDGLRSPHTPLRRFLDRELSAGPKALRDSYRAQHRADHILLPPPGVATEAGTVGTAIDQRLRLAFTAAAPVDDASLKGINLTAGIGGRGAGLKMRAVGNELVVRLTEAVRRLDLDNRRLPVDRAQDEEEDLARMLIAAAWYQVRARTTIGFVYTPLAKAAFEDPRAFTFERLLELPHPDMVSDVVAQLHKAANGPLQALRARTTPEDSVSGPTFAGAQITADADIVVDGLLLDFKSARHPLAEMSQRTAWQLAGYLLLDTVDRYRIDTVGLYLTRTGVLASWPVDDFLALLGACRRDITELRGVFARTPHRLPRPGRRPLLRHRRGDRARPAAAGAPGPGRPARLLPGVHPAPARIRPPTSDVLHQPLPRALPDPAAPRTAPRRPRTTAPRPAQRAPGPPRRRGDCEPHSPNPQLRGRGRRDVSRVDSRRRRHCRFRPALLLSHVAAASDHEIAGPGVVA
ncbi:hypothetical protein [Streptomyces sasae]|uniref:hypothetical protein n=1 Tax=Streptomyces sasae TaxID=1266772 RepID=UPI00292FC0D6|nr:hypothetical protein [Streptomyces sasae]